MAGRDCQHYQRQERHDVLSLRPAEDKERHDPILETTKRRKRLDEHILGIVTYQFL